MTRFNTQLVHGLPVGDNNTGAVNPPIYNSTTYAFEKVDAMPRYDYELRPVCWTLLIRIQP